MGRQVAGSAVWGSSLLSRAMRTVESVFQSVAVWRARGVLLWPAGCQVAVAKLKLCLQGQGAARWRELRGTVATADCKARQGMLAWTGSLSSEAGQGYSQAARKQAV